MIKNELNIGRKYLKKNKSVKRTFYNRLSIVKNSTLATQKGKKQRMDFANTFYYTFAMFYKCFFA